MKAKKCAAIITTILTAGALMTGCGSMATVSAAENTAEEAEEKAAEETTEETTDKTSGKKSGAAASGTDNTAKADTADDSSSDSAEDGDVLASATGNVTTPLLSARDVFSNRDLKQTVDTSDAQKITVSDGEDVSITEEGIYVISGAAKDVTIEVNAPDAKVQLVLDDLSVTNEDKPAIYVKDADKVFVTTLDGGENTLSVTGTYTADGDTNLDAVIFAKSDLTLNGEGTLTIASAEGNGISSKDDLTITGGTYDITCAKHGLEAHDSVSIADGIFTIDSGRDGIHSEDSDDDSVGTILITGGTFDIAAGDDGMQGTTITEIDDGNFDIDAVEGIEGTYVQINGGEIDIAASDDGINAAQKSTQCDIVITVNDGSLTIVMGSGDTDALDANGSIYVNGGTLDITAPMSSFDYDREGVINGGTVTVNGEEVTEMPADMMGGGRGGMGGPGGNMGGMGGRGGMMQPGSNEDGTEEDGNFDGTFPGPQNGRGRMMRPGSSEDGTADNADNGKFDGTFPGPQNGRNGSDNSDSSISSQDDSNT